MELIGSATAGSGGVTDGVDDELAPPTLLTEDTEVDTERIWLLARGHLDANLQLCCCQWAPVGPPPARLEVTDRY